jgi:aspartate racemase
MTQPAKTESTREKILGIIGGMGPEATIDLMQRIINNTPAQDDIDHIHCLVDNNPKIPSRMKAILTGDGENPGPCMAEMARRLEKWGADFLVIPCNTAHHYYSFVSEAVSIPVINLIELVAEKVITDNPGITEIGILGSTTIIKTELYKNAFSKRGVNVVYPDDQMQDKLFQVIKNVKSGNTNKEVCRGFSEICKHMEQKNVKLAVLGCTELGIISESAPIPTLDAAELLAQEIVAVVKKGKVPYTS